MCLHMVYPDDIQDMIDDFAFLDDWEDRYMHVIEMGKALEPLTKEESVPANKVNDCVSQVWLITKRQGDQLFYRGDSDAHIVKGLVAIAIKIFSGRSVSDITAMDAETIMAKLGLSEHLSRQRSNGLQAMIARIKRDAETLA